MPTSRYAEFAPPAALRPYVRCLWVHHVDEPVVQPVLPDGCIDVVAGGGRVVLAGPATRTSTLRLPAGATTVGVRFRPGAAPALVGADAAEVRDLDVPLDELWGRSGTAVAAAVLNSVEWRSSLERLVDGLTDRLDQARDIDPVGVGVARMLGEQPGVTLDVVAEHVGLSERQLRRRVEDAVGYSPRTLSRILRFQRFLDAARSSGPDRQLARLAADAGYADQAHLTRESRALSGLPPAALLDWEADRLA